MQLVPSSSIRAWTAVGASKTPSGISTVCPHCGERGVFTLSNAQDDIHRLAVASSAKCPGCSKLVRFWAVRAERSPKSDERNPEAVYMYPPAKNHYPASEFQSDIPQALQNAFISTIDAYNSRNYAATAVCARRTLEGIFKYLVPEEKRNVSLMRLIEYVKSDTDLAAPLTSLSHAIRDGGNLGAHFDMEKEPDQVLAKHMVELLDYLISYLYVLPKEIKNLEESLGKNA
ncbi:DUF4145 domain-containing protein [Pseudomonas jilinensis]|uniref:DUF4145 domain-containing protein n=1 Tax=Pseudomonas jilinensis TaxID=2078689 RepID=A0A396RU07_9PSED|nr:DUF4145 domain-containing protein [Pseudomonas jilinensis]RHW19616.1 hypothetical protein C2846_17710 [Pseudomonas jilinensis]